MKGFFICFIFGQSLTSCIIDGKDPAPCYGDFFVKGSKAVSILELKGSTVGCGGISKTIERQDSALFKVKVVDFSSSFPCPVLVTIQYNDSTMSVARIDTVKMTRAACYQFDLFFYSINDSTYANDTIVFP
ncbi:MAG TPA: hypothetical protein PKY12_03210 [Catalimonadaceae bacterium]|nr:hypothetical protein [Catalimonadaceae bacterium]